MYGTYDTTYVAHIMYYVYVDVHTTLLLILARERPAWLSNAPTPEMASLIPSTDI